MLGGMMMMAPLRAVIIARGALPTPAQIAERARTCVRLFLGGCLKDHVRALPGAAGDHLGRIDERGQPINGMRDARVVGVGFRITTKELDQRLLGPGDRSISDGLVNVGVARRSGPLAAPSHLAPDNLLGGLGDVGGLVHNRRVHPAEFE
jgi:hypothetical protein